MQDLKCFFRRKNHEQYASIAGEYVSGSITGIFRRKIRGKELLQDLDDSYVNK
jgi:hypothetical protein